MRNRAAASEVVRRLRTLAPGFSPPPEAEDLTELFRSCLEFTAQAVEPSLRPGWNKFWTGNSLVGWFGEIVAIEPLRLAALEIAADPDEHSAIREALILRTRGETAVIETSVRRRLAEFGVSLVTDRPSIAERRLLDRLNLDLRERPFIEKFRWSQKTGLLKFSDEGRAQIAPAFAWSRGIEAALDGEGRLDRELAAALAEADAASPFIPLPDSAATERLIDRLHFLGFAHRWRGGAMFAVSSGVFPSYLGRLYGGN